ncbi:uncharacterized protein LOC134488319 [Candoia aspera]|uniref:uncharacterized protein LOC134488319 n=1 Tax=Candoia aspera TaxID=51853 RepID=UPI002FD7A1D3
MWGLLAALLFLPLGCLVDAACPLNNSQNLTGPSGMPSFQPQQPKVWCLNFSGEFPGAEVNDSVGNQVKVLDLSNNKIQRLLPRFLESAANLKSLFLHNNTLKTLPSHLFSKTPNLKVLSIERNQLASLPIEDFHHCLEKLSVDCSCNVAGSIFQYCYDCSASGIKCQCFSSEMLVNVTDYYTSSCQGMGVILYLAIMVPILVLLLLAILAYFLIQRKKGAKINQEKRPSDTSEGTSRQPRYISHLSSPGNTFQDMKFHKDYENIYNDESKCKEGKMKSGQGNHQSRKQTTKRCPSKGENVSASEGHQPIYANTQEVYCNYSGEPIPDPVEDVYIIPDQ